MPGNRPCPDGCDCEKHSRSKDHISALGRKRKPCPDGCNCGRHNSEARRKAAEARWAKDGQREAQSEVGRRVAEANNESRSADFTGWIARIYGGVEADAKIEEPVSGLDEHRALAERLGIRVVKRATLRRYGLTELEWLEHLARQGWRCPVCRRRVEQFVTDHEHVKGWAKLPPEDRKRYVRGLLCVYDNYKVVPSRMSAEEAGRMAAYLHDYENRRDK